MTSAPTVPIETSRRSATPPTPPTAVPAFIKKHPVLTYYALTFAISWGGILLVIGGPGEIPGNTKQIETLTLFVVLALFAGPSVAGILLTSLVHGRAGFRELISQLRRWRVGGRWYAVALLTAPLVFTAVALTLSLASPAYLPAIVTTNDKVFLLLFGIAWGLVGAFLEEIGWTGFAVPGLRRHYGVLTTGLIVGVLWGTWHSLMSAWLSPNLAGGLPVALFLPTYVLVIGMLHLTAYRVLIVWVYDQTGSLLVAWLMHASFAASTFILGASATGLVFLTWSLRNDRRAVARCCSGGNSQPRAALATIGPVAGGFNGVARADRVHLAQSQLVLQ
jgi:membrane protease YdiL (CAAX protease family)